MPLCLIDTPFFFLVIRHYKVHSNLNDRIENNTTTTTTTTTTNFEDELMTHYLVRTLITTSRNILYFAVSSLSQQFQKTKINYNSIINSKQLSFF